MKTILNKGKHHHHLFTRANYLLLGVSCMLIILGLLLMAGESSTITHFETGIFSFRRIVLAPIITLIGYLMVIVAILFQNKSCEGESW